MQPPSRLVLGPLPGGLQTYDQPFFLNNDAFPTLNNALCWRHRIIKKPGSKFLGQFRRSLGNTGASPFTATISPAPLLHGTSQFTIGGVILVDGDLSGGAVATLTSSNGSYSGTLNRTTGALSISIPAIAATPVYFYPGLPVMGIEEFESSQDPNSAIDTPDNVYFDTVYSYKFNGTTGFFEDNSIYVSTSALVSWSGQNYQQFDSCNYFRAMFTTNNVPGYHGKAITAVPAVGATTQLTITGHGLTTNDYIFVNEVGGVTNLNGFYYKVNSIVDIDNITVVTAVASGGAFSSNGIALYITRSVSGDGIRWYDGTAFSNFMPPLATSAATSITYLVGARIVIPFGNRLLAIGTYEATKADILAGTNTYFGNRIRYCEVAATPFYANFPTHGSSEPNAWVSNIQGFGGFIDLDTTQRIISAAITQSSLILGLEAEQRKVTLTGIETDPFTLQVINPDYGTAGTHSIIPMDKGILTAGEYGFITTSSYDAKRFDLPIIDQIFQVNPDGNGYERISGGRDFAKEVIYFSYPSILSPDNSSSSANQFPDTTLVYNYREGSFATWTESITTYGLIKTTVTGSTWQSLTYLTWEEWDDPWNSGPDSVSSYPYVGMGTPQGYVLLKWATESTNGPSLNIQAIAATSTSLLYLVTSVNNNLKTGMYIGFFAPISASDLTPQSSPSFIGQVAFLGDGAGNNLTSQFGINFDSSIDPSVIVAGSWKMSVVDKPFIQTKQFQSGWSDARKTRIGAQKYFLDRTNSGEFTAQILGSQSPDPLNSDPNNEPSLISNAVVRTRPDNNLGLNANQGAQEQIWHRLASSCIGDTVQLQMTLSDSQMRDVAITSSAWVLYSIILDLYPSRTLA